MLARQKIQREWQVFLLAVGFLTRIPIPADPDFSDEKLNGASREDGFADSCDGFGGGWRAEDVLRIMKDSRIGTYGTVALVLVLGLKAATLLAMPSTGVVVSALLWAHIVSRWLATSYLLDLHYVRGEGKSKPLATTMSLSHWLWSGLPILPLLIFTGLPALFSLIVVLLIFRFAFAAYLRRRIGGYTGDALGAAQQVTEIIIYLAFLA